MDRRLSAILAADLVGYSTLMEQDEEGTLTRLAAVRDTILRPTIEENRGRLFKTTGDGFLVEFSSAVSAVKAALAIQNRMAALETQTPDGPPLQYRIGVNLGDVIADGDDIFGDGVNVAARLEEIADPGGIAISGAVNDQITGKVEGTFIDTGHKRLKNIEHTVHVYQLMREGTRQDALMRPAFDFEETPGVVLHTGGCLCGAVRFEITRPPIDTGYCHCRICQKFTGSAVSVWTAFPTDALRFTSGEPTRFSSTNVAERGFCGRCGSSLTWQLISPERARYLAVFTPSLDDPSAVTPTCHGGMESRLPWFDIHDDLPRSHTEQSQALRRAWAAAGLENPADWGPPKPDRGD